MRVKKEIRTLGIDDSPFKLGTDRHALLVGVIYRGNMWPEGIEIRPVEVDGVDSTSAITDMIIRSKHRGQLRVVFLSGVTFAGLNLANPDQIVKETSIPVVTVTDRKPNLDEILRAVEKTSYADIKKEILINIGKPEEVVVGTSGKRLYIKCFGISLSSAIEVIRTTRRVSAEPEAIRVAKLFASSLPRCSELKNL